MSRGMVIFLVVVALIAGLGFWGLPILKRKLVGESFQVQITVTMAVDDYEVMFKDKSVSRTVVGLELVFPMGSAPDNPKDLEVRSDDGNQVQVEWTRPEREDSPDKGTTKLLIREAFFPIGFRQGLLRTKHRDLGYIRLPQVPYNAQKE